jgi:pimeloyl-ACP methyl ester carboxylesterase
MQEAIETRELIVLDGLDVITRGTYHKTCDDYSGAQTKLIEQGQVGVLFLNPPSPTRAAQGDSAVYWADAFAERGYPSFRLDLPGVGDSEGDSLTEILDSASQDGYAPIASAKIRELVRRFNLEGVVIVEQCSTSISTLYAAANCAECRGLVLMDPCFDLSHVIEPPVSRHPSDRMSEGCRRLSRNSYGSATRPQPFSRTVSSDNSSASHHRLKDGAFTELPILIFRTLNRQPMDDEVDYLRYIIGLAGRKAQIVNNILDGTKSSFTSRVGRLIIRQCTELWLTNCFPLANCQKTSLMP